ncbi:MAG: MerR family transcriptional regulator [Chloroflexota bacterium]|nr:MerR family transcriptional regulator [Chloroflexota bacterium]
MSEPSSPLISVAGVAREMGVSTNAVRKWEALGIIPAAQRVEPGSRRVYRLDDLEVIRERVEERRAGGRRQPDPERV